MHSSLLSDPSRQTSRSKSCESRYVIPVIFYSTYLLLFKAGRATPLAAWPTTTPEIDRVETIVSFRYLSSSAAICCILGGGDIVLLKVETEIHEDKLEIIGNVEGGVLAAEWTVDEEVLAVVSGPFPLGVC
jgi:hypothetical protein